MDSFNGNSINIVLLIITCISFLISIYCMYKTKKNEKTYVNFMKKIGNGTNLDDMLKKYIADLNLVKQDNEQIKAYYTKLDNDINNSIQKLGLVRYNAFKDVGSNLSFTLALLDRDNNGVVLNGLYGSTSSNIYAKPVKNGQSKYPLSDEEIEAISIAIKSER